MDAKKSFKIHEAIIVTFYVLLIDFFNFDCQLFDEVYKQLTFKISLL